MLFLFWAPAQSIVFPEIKHQGVFNIIFFIRPGNTPYLYSLSSSFCCSSEHFMTLAKFKLISYFSVLSTSLAGQLTGTCLGTFLGEEPAEEPTDVSSQDPQIPTGIPAELLLCPHSAGHEVWEIPSLFWFTHPPKEQLGAGGFLPGVTGSCASQGCWELPGNHSMENNVDLYLLLYFPSREPSEAFHSLIS